MKIIIYIVIAVLIFIIADYFVNKKEKKKGIFFDKRKKRELLTYEERVQWFVNNHYETGMEYNHMLMALRYENLDKLPWNNDIINIPKYKDKL